MAHHADLTQERSVQWCKELLMQPPGPWPSGDWVGYPNIIQAVRDLLTEAATNPPAPPTWSIPRGIVIAGGGWRFFPSIYVTVRVLRMLGCQLPIQVWYLGDWGEFDARMLEMTREYGVGWIDAHSWWRENPQFRIRRDNIDNGWMLKPFAALGCPFREVLFLDADAYPVYDPSTFLDQPEVQRVGAVFWPDQNPLEPGQWERFGVPPHDVPGLESGQFFIDKARHWKPLWCACLLNALHDFTYKHLYGDKDTFNIAWRKCGHEMCVPTSRPGWHVHTFLQKDFAGRPFILHRTRDKFKLTGEIDGQGISQFYMTRQRGPDNRFVADLPHEGFCFHALRQCSELLRPEQHFDLAGHAGIADVWARINRQNEYRFGWYDASRHVAVDLGANVGAATHCLLSRNMMHVFAVEPFEPNCVRLSNNLKQWDGRYTLLQNLAWRSPRCDYCMPLFAREDDPAHTGNLNSHTRFGEQALVKCVPLDSVLRMAAANPSGRVRLLKIDVEGSEYIILYTSERLDLVDEIIGELHDVPRAWEETNAKRLPPFRPKMMAAFLEAQGFEVKLEENGPGTMLFWARRPAQKS
jgi:FkbM family methyltransferase